MIPGLRWLPGSHPRTEPNVVRPQGVDYAHELAYAEQQQRDTTSRNVRLCMENADLTGTNTALKDENRDLATENAALVAEVEQLQDRCLRLMELAPADHEATWRRPPCQAVISELFGGRWEWRCELHRTSELYGRPHMAPAAAEQLTRVRAEAHEQAYRYDSAAPPPPRMTVDLPDQPTIELGSAS